MKVFDKPADGQSATAPSGLNFLAQVKSIDDSAAELDALEVRYRLRTTDLVHWEDNQPPVVVVIWNVATKTGHWILAQDGIRALNEGTPQWRSQETATVRIPVEQLTDDDGLQRLRRKLADIVLPSYRRDRPLDVTLRVAFPPSADGLAQSDALRNALDRGIPCTIQGEYVAEVVHPDWFKRLYGDALPEIAEVTIAPKPPDRVFDAQAEVRAPGVLEAFPLKLRISRAGRQEVEFVTDASTKSPISLKMLFRLGEPGEVVLGLSVNLKVASARVHAPMLRVFSEYEKGTPINIFIDEHAEPLATVPPGVLPLPESLSEMVEAVEHLLVLEKYVVLERPINLERLDDDNLGFLRAFARAFSTGGIAEKVSAKLRGVTATVKDDVRAVFNFDHRSKLMGGVVRFENTTMIPETDAWRETAVVARDGTLTVEIPSFRLGVREADAPA